MSVHRLRVLAPALLVVMALIAISGCNTHKNGGEAQGATPGASQPPAVPTPGDQSPTPTSPADISLTQVAQLIPLAPASVTAEKSPSGIQILWPGTGQDVVYYLVYRKDPNEGNWHQIAKVEASGENRGQYLIVDSTVQPGMQYIYGVGAVNFVGKESAITPSNVVTRG